MSERVYLTVPFIEKDAAKELGARWDSIARRWYIQEHLDQSLFLRWLPITQAVDDDRITLDQNTPSVLPLNILSSSGDAGLIAQENSSQGLTLSRLLQQVNQIVTASFSQSIWVKAEVTEVMQRQGHYYLTLAESVNGQQVAQVKANLWSSRAAALLAKFSDQTGGGLQAGANVLLQVSLSVHARFGLTLTIVDIDPTFTLGDQAAKLNALRQMLITNGLYGQNKQFKLPETWTRVAIISPSQAAGLGDFKSDANRLEALGLCHFTYFYATFQGASASQELQSALAEVTLAHHQQAFDVCVIIRGGGAKQDLMYLNDALVAQTLCQMPLPVLTGIGHERDNTILDEVANTRFDTPSKVVSYITERIVLQAQSATRHWLSVVQYSQRMVQSQQQIQLRLLSEVRTRVEMVLQEHQFCIKQHKDKIVQSSLRQLHTQKQALALNEMTVKMSTAQTLRFARHELNQFYTSIAPSLRNTIQRHQQQLQTWHQFLQAQHPENLLRLGYAMVRDEAGKLVTSQQQAKRKKLLSLQFKDGFVSVSMDANQPEVVQEQLL